MSQPDLTGACSDARVEKDERPRRATDADLAELESALRAMAPVGVRVGARRLDAADIELLLPAELASIEAARPIRRREFAGGRVLLRRLLASSDPFPTGADRAPELPAGTTASLAHDRCVAIAAVSSRHDAPQVGIDIEPRWSVDERNAPIIRRPDDQIDDSTTLLVVKEAVFKAWSRSGGAGLLDFHDVAVRAVPTSSPASRCSATVTLDQSVWSVQTSVAAGWVVALATSDAS